MKKNGLKLKLLNLNQSEAGVSDGFYSIRGGAKTLSTVANQGSCQNAGCTNTIQCGGINGACTNKENCNGSNKWSCDNANFCA